MLEARCKTCGENFNPHSRSKDDLEHGMKNDGTPCGGEGVIVAEWHPDRRQLGKDR